MADQRISQLTKLAQGDVAANDVLAIVDVGASTTKKVEAKDLFQAGANLADSASIDLIKLNQSSTTKLGTTALADDAVTAAKLGDDSSIAYDSVAPSTNNFEGRGYVNSTSKNLQVWDGSAFQQVVAPTTGIENLAVTTGKLANNAVTTAKVDATGLAAAALATDSVITAKIQDLAVTTGKLAALSVTTAKIAADAVTADELASNAVVTASIVDANVTEAKLATGSVTEAKIGTAAVTVAKVADASLTYAKLNLADASVPGAKLVSNSVTSTQLAVDAVTTGAITALNVTTAKLADGAVTAAKLGALAVTTAKIAADAVTAAELANDAVDTAAIVNAAVTEAKLAAGAVTEAKIATSAVTVGKIADTQITYAKLNLADGSVPGAKLVSNSVTSTQLAVNAVTTGALTDLNVTTGKLADSAVTNAKLATGAITTAKIDAAGLGEAAIATSAVTTSKVLDGAITAAKLAADSTTIVQAGTPVGSGAYEGQLWFDTNTSVKYVWNGSAWIRQAALNSINFSDTTPLNFAVAYPDNHTANITTTLDTQDANAVFVGPTSGADAAPTFRALTPADLPNATASTKGIVQPGTGLAVNAGVLNHSNSVAPGTYTRLVVDAQGHISQGQLLEASDIPNLDVAKITTGELSTARIADAAITIDKLANYSTASIGTEFPEATFTGQLHLNSLDRSFYMWDGNVYVPIGISAGQIVLAGTFDASSPSGVGKVQSLTPEGVAAGFVVNSALPVPTLNNSKHYFVVSEGGTITSGNAPAGALAPPDLLLSVYSTTLPQWVEIDVSAGAGAIAAANVSFVPAGDIAASNVQTAIEEVSTECRNATNITSGTLAVARGGTNVASYTKGDLLAASAATTLTKLPVGTNGQVLRANSATATGLEYGADFVGTVTTVTSSTTALTVANPTTTPALTVRAATTSVDGIVQLSDSTNTTSSVLAATPTAVKSAYDLAALALPKAGGTVTGELLIGSAGTLVFEGSTDDGNEITLAVADPTADRTITLPNVTGTVVTTGDSGTVTSTMIADGTVVNTDISASAAIVDTKLATIATAGKVSNSATTATSANTASAIVARNASGDFSAGTITASLSGNASTVTTNANLTGDVTSVGNATSIAAGVIVNANINASAAIAGTKISPDFGSQTVATTGIFSHALGSVSAPTITFTGDTNTGIYSPGADQVAISTNGSASLSIDSIGNINVNRGSLVLSAVGPEGGELKLQNPTNTGTVYHLDANTATNARLFTTSNNTNLQIGQLEGTGGLITFHTSTTERLRIDSSGKVGIGTSAPNYQLHVTTDFAVGASGFNQQLSFTNDTIQSLLLGTGYTALKLNPLGGNVGINTSTPTSQLEVIGSIKGVAGSFGLFASNGSGTGQTSIGLRREGAPTDQKTWEFFSGASGEFKLRTINDTYTAGQDVFGVDRGTGVGVASVQLHTNGSERLRIDSSGRLGIGTSAPVTSLEVSLPSASATIGNIRITPSTAGQARYYLYNGGSVAEWLFGQKTSTDHKFKISTSVAGSETDVFTIDTNGNVGIGTTSPEYKLVANGTIKGVAGTYALLASNGSGSGQTGIGLVREGGTVDEKYWEIHNGASGELKIRAINDTYTSAQDALMIGRGSGATVSNFQIHTNGSERARIDSVGRFGIGTSSPNYTLDLNSGAATPAQISTIVNWNFPGFILRRNASNVSTAKMLSMILQGDTDSDTTLTNHLNIWGTYSAAPTTGSTTAGLSGVMNLGAPSGIALHVNGSERGRVDSSGRLLVGASSFRQVGTIFSPSTNIQVEGSGDGFYQVLTGVANRNDANGPVIGLGKSRGVANGSSALVQSGDSLGDIIFAGADGVDLSTIACSIGAYVDGAPGTDDMPGRLVFSTTADGASSPTERMRITQAGNVGIGASGPGTSLDVQKPSASATIGNIRVAPTSTGQARYHLFNGGAIAEWLFGQKTSTDHDFKLSKSVAGSEADYVAIKTSGIINIAVPPTYADNAAATSGGLVAGDIYRKSDGTLMIRY